MAVATSVGGGAAVGRSVALGVAGIATMGGWVGLGRTVAGAGTASGALKPGRLSSATTHPMRIIAAAPM